ADCIEVGSLDITRDFTDVRDVVRAYRLLAMQGCAGVIYNLGSGRGTKIADALNCLRSFAKTDTPVRVDHSRMRSVDPPLLIADPSRLRAAVDWVPHYTIEQTLADMLESCRRQLSIPPG